MPILTTPPRSVPAATGAPCTGGERHCDADVRATMHWGRTGVLVSVAGRINAANADRFISRVHCAACGDWLVVDVTALESIDNSGISALDAINIRCERIGVRWALVAGDVVQHAVRHCGLNTVVPISASLTEALVSVQGHPSRQ
ncbi:STAS domain-containing protein [Mycolicibacterium mageritense]|nr:STAS domain-containing protein [Mycolicibacterium mageritense]